MDIFANSEDPNEMLQNAAFHRGLHFCYDKYILQGLKYIINRFFLPVTP